MTGTELTWTFRPHAEGWDDVVEPDEVVWIDVAALDRAWRLSDEHVGPGGLNGQDERYPRAGRWFAENHHSDMPCVGLDGAAVAFTDGRHRFAWLRDQGVAALPVQVSPSVAPTFRRRFGTAFRASILPAPKEAEPPRA